MSGAALLLLVRMNDLGSSFLLYGTVIAMVYVATGRWLYVAFGVGLFALGAWLAAQVAPQVDERLQAWLDPWKDERDNGFQIVQSLYTIADGGIFGTGLGPRLRASPTAATPSSRTRRPTSSTR